MGGGKAPQTGDRGSKRPSTTQSPSTHTDHAVPGPTTEVAMLPPHIHYLAPRMACVFHLYQFPVLFDILPFSLRVVSIAMAGFPHRVPIYQSGVKS